MHRVGASILQNCQQTFLITESENEYVAKAIELSSKIRNLGLVKNTLREQFLNSPVCNESLFIKNYENALKEIMNEQ